MSVASYVTKTAFHDQFWRKTFRLVQTEGTQPPCILIWSGGYHKKCASLDNISGHRCVCVLFLFFSNYFREMRMNPVIFGVSNPFILLSMVVSIACWTCSTRDSGSACGKYIALYFQCNEFPNTFAMYFPHAEPLYKVTQVTKNILYEKVGGI